MNSRGSSYGLSLLVALGWYVTVVAGWVVGTLGVILAVYLATAVVAAQATALIGHTPPYPQPGPQGTHCVPVSGGRGCSGG
jgi:hypothetical protein